MNSCLYDTYGSYSCSLPEKFTDINSGVVTNAASGIVANISNCYKNHSNEWCGKCHQDLRYQWCRMHNTNEPDSNHPASIDHFADVTYPSPSPFNRCPPIIPPLSYVDVTIPPGQFIFPQSQGSSTVSSVLAQSPLMTISPSAQQKKLICFGENLSITFGPGSGVDYCKVYLVVTLYSDPSNKSTGKVIFDGSQNPDNYYQTSQSPDQQRNIPYTFTTIANMLIPMFIQFTDNNGYIDFSLKADKTADDQCTIKWTAIQFKLQ